MLAKCITRIIPLGVLLCAKDVNAHVFVGDGGPGAGFIHPLTGPDHLLAMFTVGLLSARISGAAIWTIPAAFLFGMSIGGGLGISGARLVDPDCGVAVSVVLLGTMLLLKRQPTGLLALGAAAVFGLFHGYAHGVEMPRVAAPALYALGFLAATAGLHLMGALTGLLIECRRGSRGRFRAVGALITLAGLFFLSQITWHAPFADLQRGFEDDIARAIA